MRNITALIFFCFCALFTNTIYAQTGRAGEVTITIDPTFSTNGRFEADPGGFGGQITGFFGGKNVPIIASGILNTGSPGLFHIGMVKLDSINGLPYPGFGHNGLVDLSWSVSDYSNDMQQDNTITGWILGGSGSQSGDVLPAVYNIKTDGTPNMAFGNNGRFAAPFAKGSTGEATNIFFFGTKYFVYGVSRAKSAGTGVSGFGMMGVTLNGTFDSTVGDNGSSVIPAPVHSVHGFYGWKDGTSSVLCGISDTGKHEILLALFNINGKPNSSFGVNGLVHTGVFAQGDTILCLKGDTNIIVLLPTPDSLPTPLRMCSFDTSGKLDLNFHHGSGIVTNFIRPSFHPKGLSLNADLSQNIAGMAKVGLGQSMYVRISDTTAAPDSIFNGNGIVTIDVDNGANPNYLKFIRNAGKVDQLGKVKRFIGFGGSIHNGVENFMITRLISSPISGVAETNLTQENFSLYPNPASSFFTVNTGAEQLKSIHIIDAIGREGSIPFHSNSGEITSYTCDVSKLPNGIYYCIMQTEKGLVARKFIKN